MNEDTNAARSGSFAGTLAERPDISGRAFSGRGIVVCAGGVRMFTNAWVLVWVLRKVLNCALPIEVWHFGSAEMSSGMRGMIVGLGARTVDAGAVLARFPARIEDGWQLKAYALIRSTFREVLLLDADNVPAIDPAFLFDHPQFVETGAVFWPDLVDVAATNPIWDECDLPAEQHVSFESGQVLVDKGRHGKALKALLYLTEEADRFYQMVYGDKDTFLVAWLATRSRFARVPHRPFAEKCIIYQRDFDGNVVFQHRTNLKWSYLDSERRSDEFAHEDACLEAVAELRRLWNGRIFDPPTRSLAARGLERGLVDRLLVLSVPGYDDCVLEFLPGSQIGRGRDVDRQAWYVTEPEPEKFILRILDHCRVRHEFCWRGDMWIGSAPGGAPGVVITVLSDSSTSRGEGDRDCGLVRDVLGATLAGGEWTAHAADALRTTLATLCRVDPRLADDLLAFVTGGYPDGAVRNGLLAMAAELKSTLPEVRDRDTIRPPAAMLGDHRLYVQP